MAYPILLEAKNNELQSIKSEVNNLEEKVV